MRGNPFSGMNVGPRPQMPPQNRPNFNINQFMQFMKTVQHPENMEQDVRNMLQNGQMTEEQFKQCGQLATGVMNSPMFSMLSRMFPFK